MKQYLISISALLFAVALLNVGEALLNTVVVLRADIEGFTVTEIGSLTSGYYFGFLIGCFLTPHFVARVGHIRTYSALAAMAGTLALFQILIIHITFWILVRIVWGICLAGLYMVVESWLNEQATNKNRAQVFSVYRIFGLCGATIGQFMLTVYDPASFQLFVAAAIFVCLSVVTVALSNVQAPDSLPAIRIRLGKIFQSSPIGVTGCSVVGLVGGAFMAFGPIYARASGLSIGQIAAFMGLTVFMGAIMSWPLGRLSDSIDRRKLLLGIAAIAALSGIALYRSIEADAALILSLIALFGASSFSIYGIAVAQANDRAEPGYFVELAGGLLILFAIGALAAPYLAVLVIDAFGPAALFAYTAAVHFGYATFVAIRLWKGESILAEHKDPFRGVPQTTPVAFQMDPRGPEYEIPEKPLDKRP